MSCLLSIPCRNYWLYGPKDHSDGWFEWSTEKLEKTKFVLRWFSQKVDEIAKHVQNTFWKTEDQADHELLHHYDHELAHYHSSMYYVLSHVLCYKTSNFVGGPSSCKKLDLFSLGLQKQMKVFFNSF